MREELAVREAEQRAGWRVAEATAEHERVFRELSERHAAAAAALEQRMRDAVSSFPIAF
jgi:hypothetical protein